MSKKLIVLGIWVRSSTLRLEHKKCNCKILEIGFQENIIDFNQYALQYKITKCFQVFYVQYRIVIIWIYYNRINKLSKISNPYWNVELELCFVYSFYRALRTNSMCNLSPQPPFSVTFIQSKWALFCANDIVSSNVLNQNITNLFHSEINSQIIYGY